MNKKTFGFLSVTLLFLLGAIDCTGKKETAPVSKVIASAPYQEIDGATMVSYNGSRKVWILESKHIVKSLSDTGHISGNPVLMTAFDSLGKQTSKVISDSGTTDASMQIITVWGNVFVLAQNGMRVKAQKLILNQKTHRVTSDSYVQLTTKIGDVLRGKGLDAADDFSSWQFKHDVSGRFPNFKERVEHGEEFN
jgi:LPS export ABC transporter protein LptC